MYEYIYDLWDTIDIKHFDCYLTLKYLSMHTLTSEMTHNERCTMTRKGTY